MLHDYMPYFVILFIVLAIIAIQMFSTVWKRFDVKLNGDTLQLARESKIQELKDAPVSIQLKSGARIEDVRVIGYCSTHTEAPYEFKQLLEVQDDKSTRYFIRISEIEYFISYKDNSINPKGLDREMWIK